jgi:hypothetical protein
VQAHASECYRGCGRPLGVSALSAQLAAGAVTMGERPFIQELVRSMGQRWVAWMGAGMPVQAIWAAEAMSFWWLVRHTG